MVSKNRKLKISFWIIAIAMILLILICLDSARSKVLWRFMSDGPEVAEKSVLTSSDDAEEAGQVRFSKRDRVKAEKKNPFEALRRPKVRLLDNWAKITEDAARDLEFTESERIITQEMIDKHFEGMRTLLTPTIVTSESNGKTYLSIPALKDRGQSEIEKFQNDLAAVIGEERTKKVMLSLPIDEFYGGFGQFDISICVTPSVKSKTDLVLVEYKSPDTGKVISRLSTSWDLIESWLPKLFKLSVD